MKRIIPLLFLTAVIGAGGCYYDKESKLYPQPSCDTTAVKWSTVIQPIISANCAYAGCHAGPAPQQGIDLTTYASVKAIANDGSLIGTTMQTSAAYKGMPYQLPPLPDCQLAQIKTWVNAGAPNN